LLPRLPQHERGEREDDEGDEALGIHHVDAGISGNRVETARAPRMAAADAPHGEPAAFGRAVAFDRLARIFGAARHEAALATPPRAQHEAVGADQREQQALHGRRAWSWSSMP